MPNSVGLTAANAAVTRATAEEASFYVRKTKRVIDFVIALHATIFFLPIMAAIAVTNVACYRMLFHTDLRVAKNGRLFPMTKFASMRDGKVTKFGALLRYSALDELPQLLHVLIGDMSLVGPRPHTVEQFTRLSQMPGYVARTNILPGMTGLAQLRRHYDEEGLREQLVESDNEYLEKCSLWFDLGILVRTTTVFFTGH